MLRITLSVCMIFVSSITWGQDQELLNDAILEKFGQVQTLLDSDNTEETIPVLKQIDSLCLLAENYEYYIYSLIYRMSAHHDLLEYDEMEALFPIANSAMDKYQLSDGDLRVNLDFLQGCYYYDMGNMDIAESYLQDVSNYQGDGFSFRMDDVYNNLGSTFFRRGDYQQAISYYKKAISEDQSFENFTAVRARWEKNIADAHTNLEQYDKARQHYLKSKRIIETYPKNKTNLRYYTDLYEHLGEFYHNIGKLDSAHYYLNKTFNLGPEEDVLINYYKNKGVTYLKEKNLNKAQTALASAVNKSISLYSERHEKLGDIYLHIAQVYKEQNKLETALDYTQKALISSTLDFNDPNPNTNPKSNRILSRINMLEALERKADIFALQAKTDLALDNYAAAQSLIEEILSQYVTTNESRFFLVHKSKSLYNSAIAAALAQNDLELAFSFSQKSHGLILWQNYIENRATKNSGIPDSLLIKEQNLKLAISEEERKLYQAYQKEQRTSIKIYEDKLFELNRSYKKFQQTLEDNYPKFYGLKYISLEAPSISSIQKELLDKNTVLLEYFMGSDKLYTFIVSHNDVQIIQKDLPNDFSAIISKFRTSLAAPDSELYSDLLESATRLYETLFKDVLGKIEQQKNIIVIPDEEINYVPFSALITSTPIEPIKNARYDKIPFLVYDYNFSYNYSSALFLESDKLSSKDDLLVGYAPSFTPNKDEQINLDSLLHTAEEVLMINKLVGGKIYLNDNATLDQFKEDIKAYKIAHLATHASCNDSVPSDSKIHFHNQALYANEIYNLPNQLSMAVLSACDTGSGKIRKGEGIISMARAFITSGCPSVITSFWKVKDEQTSQIMHSFYAHLMAGKQKNYALNQAKRDYLTQSTVSSYFHPYYWASFVPIGNVDTIQGSSSSNQWYMIILLIALILFLLYFFSKRK